MGTRMLQRRGSAAEWEASNPILGDGELGFVYATWDFKVGDGVTNWNDLPYRNMLKALFDNVGDLLVGTGPDSVEALPAGGVGTHLEVQADGTLAWVVMPPFALAADVAATYETISSELADQAIRETIAHAAATYEPIAHAAATYETQAHAAGTYETLADAATRETVAHAAATYNTIANATSAKRKWTKSFMTMGA